jgi:hypothetical protein
LRALYTIMLGNPQLTERGAAQTRFKTCWRLIGSAVENAAYCEAEKRGRPVLFKEMFARTEARDEEARERADVIQALYAISEEFSAPDVYQCLADSGRKADECGITEEDGTIELRRFCTNRLAKAPSVKSISLALQSITDAPVAVLAGIVSLKENFETHAKKRTFFVELKGR